MSLRGTPYYDMACDATGSEEEREQLAQMLYEEEIKRAMDAPRCQCHKCGGHAYDLGDEIDCENCGKIPAQDYDELIPF